MSMKNLFVYLTMPFLLAISVVTQTAVADETKRVEMRFAGAFLTNVLRADPFDPLGAAVTSALVGVQAKGSLGRAVIQGSGGRGDTVEVPAFECLGSSGLFLKVNAAEDPLVMTFRDLSLLFANGSGVICVDLTTGASVFEFDIMFTGGRGRFQDASGFAVIKGEAEPVSNDGSFLGETGTISGWLTVPRGADGANDDGEDE